MNGQFSSSLLAPPITPVLLTILYIPSHIHYILGVDQEAYNIDTTLLRNSLGPEHYVGLELMTKYEHNLMPLDRFVSRFHGKSP